MSRKRLVIAIGLLVFTISCAMRKNLETPFNNPQNTPVINDGGGGSSGTKFCAPDTTGKFDGVAVAMTSGLNSNDGSAWAEGGGCVERPIREAWAVINNVQAMKFKAADRVSFVRTVNPKPGFTHLYDVTYYKSTIIGDLNWTIDWYHSYDKGTFAAPQGVNINYQRTRGTSNIPVWSGGIVLTKVTDKITSIAIRNNFKARQSSSDNEDSARSALSEMIDHIRNADPDWDALDAKTELE
jgi:hypothetical protein